jgi:hypothetical protein
LTYWNQWFNTAPKLIGDFPCFRFCHLASKRGHRAWKVIILYLRISSKTKRPAASNPAGCEVKATKFSEGGCDWLVVFWMRFDYRVDALILVPLTVLKKMYASSFAAGKSIEVHPKHFENQFSQYCARSSQDLSTVAWKDKIADKKILVGFFSK